MRRFIALVTALAGIAVVAVSTPASASDGGNALSLVGFQHIVVDDAQGRVFLTGSSGLDVRDLSGAEVATGLDLDAASGMALSADGSTLYVTQRADNAIAVIDTASLAQLSSIGTGAGTCPSTLSLLGSTLWFGYGCAQWSGAVGAVDLSQTVPTVTLNADTNGSAHYYAAPLLASSAQVPSILFVAQPGLSPSRIRSFDVSGQALAAKSVTDTAQPIGFVGELAITPDGKDLLVATTQWQVPKYATSDLSYDGNLVTNSGPDAVAVAADGTIAVGLGDPYAPAAYTYAADGSFKNEYPYAQSETAAAAGLAFSADSGVLYAVTAPYATTSGYTLHVTGDLGTPLPRRAFVKFSTNSFAALDDPLTVTGTLTDIGGPIPAATLSVTKSDSSATNRVLPTVTTQSDGSFAFTDVPDVGGTTTYWVGFAGDTLHPAPPVTGQLVEVSFLPTALTLSVSPTTLTDGARASISAHLGQTDHLRHVDIYAVPVGKDPQLIKSGTVDASGNLALTYVMHANMTFYATFAGELRYGAAVTPSLERHVRPQLQQRAIGYYRHSGAYWIYHASRNAGITTKVSPNKNGENLTYQVQRLSGRTWTTARTGFIRLNAASTATATFRGTVNRTYRIRTLYPGDHSNAPNTGTWIYLKLTK